MEDKKIQRLARGAMIAAIYVVLTMVFAPISYGAVQVRISEALTILPYFTSSAIPGLFVGCLIANLAGGAIALDVVFGSVATLLGAVGTYLLRKQNRFLAPLPPVIANSLIVPLVLKYGYGMELPIPYMMLTVGAGEVISAGVLGILLQSVILKRKAMVGK